MIEGGREGGNEKKRDGREGLIGRKGRKRDGGRKSREKEVEQGKETPGEL